jgi:hypothetical protein
MDPAGLSTPLTLCTRALDRPPPLPADTPAPVLAVYSTATAAAIGAGRLAASLREGRYESRPGSRWPWADPVRAVQWILAAVADTRPRVQALDGVLIRARCRGHLPLPPLGETSYHGACVGFAEAVLGHVQAALADAVPAYDDDGRPVRAEVSLDASASLLGYFLEDVERHFRDRVTLPPLAELLAGARVEAVVAGDFLTASEPRQPAAAAGPAAGAGPAIWEGPDWQMIGADDLARLLSISVSTLDRWHAGARLPLPVVNDGKGKVRRWRLGDVRSWVEAGCPGRDEWEQRRRAGTGSRSRRA